MHLPNRTFVGETSREVHTNLQRICTTPGESVEFFLLHAETIGLTVAP